MKYCVLSYVVDVDLMLKLEEIIIGII